MIKLTSERIPSDTCRADAVLITNESGELVGIITDKVGRQTPRLTFFTQLTHSINGTGYGVSRGCGTGKFLFAL